MRVWFRISPWHLFSGMSEESVIQLEQRNCRQMYYSHIWLCGGTAVVSYPLFFFSTGGERDHFHYCVGVFVCLGEDTEVMFSEMAAGPCSRC